MQKHFKYKNYIKIKYYNIKFPLKLLNYNTKKWKSVQLVKKIKYKNNFKFFPRLNKKKNQIFKCTKRKNYKYKKENNSFFRKFNKKRKRTYYNGIINHNIIKKKKFKWVRKKFNYRQKKLAKFVWILLFNNFKPLSLLQTNKIKNKLKLRINYFCKAFFNLQILLWALNISKSIKHAKSLIQQGFISINRLTQKKTKMLKKGDIISLKKIKKEYYIKKNINKIRKILTFIEVDFYSYNIIIIKNFNDLNMNDLHLLLEHYFNILELDI